MLREPPNECSANWKTKVDSFHPVAHPGGVTGAETATKKCWGGLIAQLHTAEGSV